MLYIDYVLQTKLKVLRNETTKMAKHAIDSKTFPSKKWLEKLSPGNLQGEQINWISHTFFLCFYIFGSFLIRISL